MASAPETALIVQEAVGPCLTPILGLFLKPVSANPGEPANPSRGRHLGSPQDAAGRLGGCRLPCSLCHSPKPPFRDRREASYCRADSALARLRGGHLLVCLLHSQRQEELELAFIRTECRRGYRLPFLQKAILDIQFPSSSSLPVPKPYSHTLSLRPCHLAPTCTVACSGLRFQHWDARRLPQGLVHQQREGGGSGASVLSHCR